MNAAAVGLVAAIACGVVGLGVPAVIARLPGPAGAVADRARLRGWAVLLSAGAGAVVGAVLGPDPSLLVVLPVVPVGVALGLVDAHAHLLPTRLIWPSLGVVVVLAGAVAAVDGSPDPLLRAAAAALLTLAVFHALWWVHPAGMGYGDVRLSALVGFVLGHGGWAELLVGVYGAFALFAVVGVVRALARRRRAVLREAVPFGPFLLGGALVGLAVAPHLVAG